MCSKLTTGRYIWPRHPSPWQAANNKCLLGNFGCWRYYRPRTPPHLATPPIPSHMVAQPARPQTLSPLNAPGLTLFETPMMKSLALKTYCHRAERPAQPQARGFNVWPVWVSGGTGFLVWVWKNRACLCTEFHGWVQFHTKLQSRFTLDWTFAHWTLWRGPFFEVRVASPDPSASVLRSNNKCHHLGYGSLGKSTRTYLEWGKHQGFTQVTTGTSVFRWTWMDIKRVE